MASARDRPFERLGQSLLLGTGERVQSFCRPGSCYELPVGVCSRDLKPMTTSTDHVPVLTAETPTSRTEYSKVNSSLLPLSSPFLPFSYSGSGFSKTCRRWRI